MKSRLVPAAAALLAAIAAPSGARAADLPPGFVEDVVCSGIDQPTSIAFLRPTLFVVSTKRGAVYAVKNGRIRAVPVLVLRPGIAFERGLNSVAIDPGFRSRGYLYANYSVRADLPFNRVSRFLVSRDGVGPEEILVEGLPSHTGVHNAGCLRFAPDGSLLFSSGDGGSYGAENPQDLSNLAGKIGRIRPDGSVPLDNPFVGVAGARPEIYAYGFRNPWRFAVDPLTGSVFANDVGSDYWEEVNAVPPGSNLGWPLLEGPGGPDGTVEPLYAYAHAGEDAAVTGGAVYRGAAYPAEFDGNYFFADFGRGSLDRIVLEETGGGVVSVERFATGLDLPVDLVVGPDECLYYLSFGRGEVRRIRWVGESNRPPVLAVTATPDSGRAPVAVTFSFAGSSDPDGDPLAFHIDFDDGSGADTSGFTLEHVFQSAGVFDVRVVAQDGAGGETEATVRVDAGNEPPVPRITSPEDGTYYSAGDLVSFSGQATDLEDGRLAESALSWEIVFHHSEHTHPFLGPIDGVSSGRFVVPSAGETASDVGYELRLHATDSRGARRTASVFLRPRLSLFILRSEPTGLVLNVDGRTAATPFARLSVIGVEHDLDAPSPQTAPDGRTLRFVGWRDSDDLARRVAIPAAGATFEAEFEEE